jgi:hypothetical protein
MGEKILKMGREGNGEANKKEWNFWGQKLHKNGGVPALSPLLSLHKKHPRSLSSLL